MQNNPSEKSESIDKLEELREKERKRQVLFCALTLLQSANICDIVINIKKQLIKKQL